MTPGRYQASSEPMLVSIGPELARYQHVHWESPRSRTRRAGEDNVYDSILDVVLSAEGAQGEQGLEFIRQLRPHWPKDRIGKKKLSGGYLNVMMKFYNEEEPSDGIVLRVFGEMSDLIGDSTISHDNELLLMQVAYYAGCYPPIVAFFSNGVAYQFANGRPMLGKDWENLVTIRAVTRALCAFHNADVAAFPLVDKKGQPATFPMDKSKIFTNMKAKVDLMPEKNPDTERQAWLENNKITATWLKAQVDEMEALMGDLDLPVTMVHYDFHQGNAIYNEASDSVTLVDFEMTHWGFEAYDIGGVIIEENWRSKLPGFYADGKPAKFTEAVKRIWAKEYITRKFELQGRDPKEVTDDVVEMMYLEHELIATFYQLWAMTGICTMLHQLNIELPVFECFKITIRDYKEERKKFPDVKKLYQAVKQRVSQKP